MSDRERYKKREIGKRKIDRKRKDYVYSKMSIPLDQREKAKKVLLIKN